MLSASSNPVASFDSALPFQPDPQMPLQIQPVERPQWNPYQNNMGTVMAITGKDFCLVTADTRMSNGFQIVSRDISKVTKLTKECVIASSGMRADVDTLHKHLKAYIFNYIAKFGREPSTAALSQLLSTTLYYRRFFPFYAFNLLCGLNKKGEGVIYGYDAIGSFDEITYGAQGSGQQLLMSVLDNQFKGHNNLNPEKLEDPQKAILVSKDVMNSCAERDIYTGDELEQFLIKKDGIHYDRTQLRKD